jgi:hypothetical protein
MRWSATTLQRSLTPWRRGARDSAAKVCEEGAGWVPHVSGDRAP